MKRKTNLLPIFSGKLLMVSLLILTSLLTATPDMAQVAPSQLLNDTRSFEVTACIPSKDKIISVWMEKRPGRKDNDADAADMRVAYKSSANAGKNWTVKRIIDMPDTFGTGNPYVTKTANGEVYLVCMHIGKDFWSGNVSLYQYDFENEEFKLKSVPHKSTEHLLDKPAIVAIGNEIHLVYIAYNKRGPNSVRYQISKDKGMTWSSPIAVFSGNESGYLGPSIVALKGNKVAISSGGYGRKNIYLVKQKSNTDSIAFESPVIVSQISGKLGAAMTEMTREGDKLILTWQNPHQRNETWFSVSKNEGDSWSEPVLLTAKGNLLSALFDKKGNIHCIYSDFSNDQYAVKYRKFNSRYEVVKEDFLMRSTPLVTFDEYLGAFQKLLIRNNELFAFWIDYPNNNSLNFTKWKF